MPSGGQMSRMQEIADTLHEMCQPLTALHCRLEVGKMNEESPSRTEAMKRVDGTDRLLAECLRECTRLSVTVVAMRAIVQRALAEEQERIG